VTGKDKTGDKLVASIRKSKTGAVAGKPGTQVPAGMPTVTAEANTGAAASRNKKPVSREPGSAGDAYSHGRRVWPD